MTYFCSPACHYFIPSTSFPEDNLRIIKHVMFIVACSLIVQMNTTWTLHRLNKLNVAAKNYTVVAWLQRQHYWANELLQSSFKNTRFQERLYKHMLWCENRGRWDLVNLPIGRFRHLLATAFSKPNLKALKKNNNNHTWRFDRYKDKHLELLLTIFLYQPFNQMPIWKGNKWHAF